MKKLVILVALAVGALTTLQASVVTINCTPSGGADPAVYPPTDAALSGVLFVCPAFTVPSGDTLTNVEMQIYNSFSNGIPDETDTVDFTYTISGFDAVSALTSDASTSSSANGIVSQTPGGPTGCVGPALTITCDEITPVTTSFSVTASSSWAAGGLTTGGSDGVGVTAFYTVVPTTPSTPEPRSFVLLGSGLLGLGYLIRRKLMT